jgi:N-acetylmuramoyl-L-alanine amidase
LIQVKTGLKKVIFMQKLSFKIIALLLHYTAASLDRTLAIFTGQRGPQVSAHYTVAEDGTIYQHVGEQDSAYHAGVSYWDGKSMINRHSIGIEQVNDGYKERESQPEGIIIEGSDRQWYPFNPAEIAATILLCQDIIARHHIEPRNVVGHGDVAPKRKVDPGPLFPWKQLAEYGMGAWPDFVHAWLLPCFLEAERAGLLEEWLIKHLHIWGYKLPDESVSAQDIIAAFQMHFRQNNISGIADLETTYILDALICNYLLADGKKCPCGYEN